MKKKRLLMNSFGILTELSIAGFLSGKIVNIPHGTSKAGSISALGVLIILIVSFSLILLFFKQTKSRKQN